MTFARRLRFRASLVRVGFDGTLGVARDKVTSYGYTLTGRKTAPATDFDRSHRRRCAIRTRATARC